MAPIIEVSDEVLDELTKLNFPYKLKNDLENQSKFDKDNFIYIPSMKIHVAKERILFGKDWFKSHKELQSQGLYMPTIPEFIEFLKYVKSNNPDIYNEITEVRNPWRAEWLDADFKVENGKLHIKYNHQLKDEKLFSQYSEILDENTLMKNKTLGISLENWINNPTSQGLPKKDCSKGNLYYWYPRSDDNSVAEFSANSDRTYFNCNRCPSNGNSVLGVRAVRRE